MRLVVRQSRGLRGEIRVPGDKSISHRAVILGAIAEGTTVVKGFLAADDCLRTVKAFEAMGIRFEPAKDRLVIHGRGLRGLSEPSDLLDMGNSGTSLRLLAGLLAGQRFFSVLTGDESLRRRPMRRVVDPLRQMGAEIVGRQGGEYAPLAIVGRPLKGIAYSLPVPSAQVKSALLLAGLFAEGTTRVGEPVPTRDHTERMLGQFGVSLKSPDAMLSVEPPERLSSCEIRVPGDFSSAAFFIVGALILPNSEIAIRGVGVNPTRTGLLEILKQMGADIRIENLREIGGEPMADLVVRSSRLKGIEIGPEWAPRTIDEFPILSVAAAMAGGRTVLRGAQELRVKESDRIATMAGELEKLGVLAEEHPDGLIIQGGRPLRGTVCSSHGDHRVAMALAVAGLAASGETTIVNTDCIKTSFPDFEPLLKSVGESGRHGRNRRKLLIAIDGPAGSGKSSAARELANRLGYLYMDTGALYRAVGWKALQDRLDLSDEAAIGKMVHRLKLKVKPAPDQLHVWIGNRDITNLLRTLEVSRAAAAVAAMPVVRERLLGLQQQLGHGGGVVMEGRDIGTVVFPKADVKFFLDAVAEVRVQRRFEELKEQGVAVDLDATQKEIDTRDLKDSRRSHAPLRRATDAVLIDSSRLSLKEVVERMLEEVRKRW